jgi:putative ABC transport system permease protein
MIRAIDRKLLRELWRLRGQMASIAAVVAAGVMTVVTMRGTYESLSTSLEAYYREYRFGHVFVELERAPEAVAARVAEIPGVAAVQTRVGQVVNLDVAGLAEPAVGQLLSVPPRPEATLNDIHLVVGRYPNAEREEEVLVSESFANANALAPGDSLGAVIQGRWRRLRIVGIAISPDYIGEIAPGSVFPDDRRFGILRMNRDALAAAAGMEGAFNLLSLRLAPGASEGAVIAELDRLLEPYGGRGAYGRDRHPSHESVVSELEQNRVSGTFIPAIFLGVAAFLLSIVLGRLIGTQRGEIAVLKAFGYSNFDVGRHYLRFALASVLLGALVGTAVGVWLGGALTELYGQFFRFPRLEYRVSWGLVGLSAGISVAAAALGALGAVRRAVRLPPAEAMRPEAPASFHPGPVERSGIVNWLPTAGRMILRNVERQPLRSLAAALGVALSVAILVVGLFFLDAVAVMTDIQFRQTQREDLQVQFARPRPVSVRYDMASLAGVTRVEDFRLLPVRIRHGHRERTVALNAVRPGATLRRVIDVSGARREPPAGGLMISTTLAGALGVAQGDEVVVQLLQGRRQELTLPVAALVDELFGLNAYVEYDLLHRLLGEAPLVSGLNLAVEDDRVTEVSERLKRLPAVASVYSPAALRASFEEQLAQSLLVSVTFIVGLASILALAIVYNGARVSLSERGRELASLRVLGFTRREVSVLLLGEQWLVTLLALPLGCVIGYGLAAAMVNAFGTERFRIPLVVSGATYVYACLVVALAAALAGLAVRGRLNRLDLIAVLKTRE